MKVRRPKIRLFPTLCGLILALYLAANPAYAQEATDAKNGSSDKPCVLSPEVMAQFAGYVSMFDGDVKQDTKLAFVPWLHPLSAERSLTAEVSEDQLVFPREGNPWLACVKRNDILWSPLARSFRHTFAVRVLDVTKKADRVVFQTENVGLDDILGGIRIVDGEEPPLVRKLRARLPSELPGGLTRGSVTKEGAGDELTLAVVYGGAGTLYVSLALFGARRLAELRGQLEQAIQKPNARKESYGERTVYVKESDVATSMSLFLDDAGLRLASFDLGSEELYAALEGLDLEALQAFAADVMRSN